MVINRRAKKYNVISYTTGTDEYGETRKIGNTERLVEMAISLFRHNQTEDIRFQDIDLVALTYGVVIVGDRVEINDDKYDVRFVNYDGRINQAYLQKVM